MFNIISSTVIVLSTIMISFATSQVVPSPCVNKFGNVSNNIPCQCGESICDEILFNPSGGDPRSCDPKLYAPYCYHGNLTGSVRGTCTPYGISSKAVGIYARPRTHCSKHQNMQSLTTSSKCKAAVEFLVENPIQAGSWSAPSPQGCYSRKLDNWQFFADGTPDLQTNDCYDLQRSYFCAVGIPCENNDGTQTNINNCLCGSDEGEQGLTKCDATTGRMCKKATAQCGCSAGSYSNGNKCIQCPAGKSSSLPFLLSNNCKSCQGGQYSAFDGQSDCTNCGAGRYLEETGQIDSSKCKACPKGRHSSAPIAQYEFYCVACAGGKFSTTIAATSSSNCENCNAGRFSESEGEIASSSCKNCPSGKSSIAGERSCSGGVTCDANTYYSGGVCQPCPSGHYCDGGTVATACDPGTYCINAVAINCQVGRFGTKAQQIKENDACLFCRIGQYQNIVGQTSCKRCPVGKYGSELGGSDLDRTCLNCPIGNTCSVEGQQPRKCLAGTYMDQVESFLEKCKECPLNTYSKLIGATNLSHCISCGTDINGKILATIATGSSSKQQCKAIDFSCPHNTSSSAKRPIGSGSQTICEDCPRGFHGNGAGTECHMCVAGTFQNLPGQRQCKVCTSMLCLASPGATTDVEISKITVSNSASDTQTFSLIVPMDHDTAVRKESNESIHTLESERIIDGLPAIVTVPIYSVFFVLIVFILGSHRFCPKCFKEFDLAFANIHYIDDTHALRRMDSRLGASMTLILPLIAIICGVRVFGEDNQLFSNGLKPDVVINDLPIIGYKMLNISVETQGFVSSPSQDFDCGDSTNGITLVDSDSISTHLECSTHATNTKVFTSTDLVMCHALFVCSVNDGFRGSENMFVELPKAFQTTRWQVNPSPWNGIKTVISHVLSPGNGSLLRGSIENPSVLNFAALRSKLVDVVSPNPDYGLQITWDSTKRQNSENSPVLDRHVVAFRFIVDTNIYVSEISIKLDDLTRFGTVLTLMLTVVAVLKVVKLVMEVAIDTTIEVTAGEGELPKDVKRRKIVLEEQIMTRAGSRMSMTSTIKSMSMSNDSEIYKKNVKTRKIHSYNKSISMSDDPDIYKKQKKKVELNSSPEIEMTALSICDAEDINVDIVDSDRSAATGSDELQKYSHWNKLRSAVKVTREFKQNAKQKKRTRRLSNVLKARRESEVKESDKTNDSTSTNCRGKRKTRRTSVVTIQQDDGSSYFYDDPDLGGTGQTSWIREELEVLDKGVEEQSAKPNMKAKMRSQQNQIDLQKKEIERMKLQNAAMNRKIDLLMKTNNKVSL